MTSRGLVIHQSRTDVSIYVSILEHLHHIGRVLNHESRKVFYIDSSVFIFKLKPSTLTLLGVQVSDLFVINFQVGAANEIFTLFLHLNLFEDILKSARHDSL